MPSGIQVHYLWANVHPKGGYNALHIHLGVPLAFVYYVQVPVPRAAFITTERITRVRLCATRLRACPP